MKKMLLLLTISFIFSSFIIFAQVDETCGLIPDYYRGESIDLNQEGGIYLTAQGELKVLVVFVRFKDDTSPHSYWPAGQPPQNYSTYIDPNLLTNSTHYNNLTHYYKKMSLGVYKITGQAVYVETPQNRSYYFSQPNPRFAANKDVLQNAVDPIINFADYDNWSSSANYNHSNQPDGTIDMIVMVWRGLQFSTWWGEASLGYGGSFTVENGTKTIKTGFGINNGSGVTCHYWGDRSPEINYKVIIHEIGHWLLGGGHPYGSQDYEHELWGMLSRAGEGICANTYERERVAWINPTPITGDILNAPFQDYVEYGSAYKYHPPNGETNENYYFENHQKLSIYDNATQNGNDKGIFVIHQRNIYSNSNNIRIKTSNGQFNWEHTGDATCFGGPIVPKFKPIAVNRAGRNNRDKLLKNGGGSEWLFYLDPPVFAGWPEPGGCGGWLHGQGLNNSFNLSFNNVFSPYSNPYTHTWSNSQNNFTMEITTQNGNVVNARFYLTNPLDGKPSKPQNLRVASSATYHPLLSWDNNIESDITSYKIYKYVSFDLGWQFLASTGGTSYEDLTEYYCTAPPPQQCMAGHDIYYRITAMDNQSKESIPSDSIKTHVQGGLPQKIASGSEQVILPNEYSLKQNYPNPFNPVTSIVFQLPKSGLVQLKVYDMLGSEIAVLVNEVKSEGSYSINFDASKLPSGVYIYSLRVNDFVQNNKMTLLK